MSITYFASGSSAPADLRGFLRIGHPLGVSIPELSEPAIQLLEKSSEKPRVLEFVDLCVPVELAPVSSVFIDTGAFSEVEMGEAGPVVVSPISDEAWDARMEIGLRLCRALGTRAVMMAPDQVGNQDETLRRLARLVNTLHEIRATGARIVVAIQRAPRDRAAFDREVCQVLGFDDFVRGIPGNKAAGTLHEVEDYLRAVRPAAVHILGMGPRSKRFAGFSNLFKRFIPDAVVSCDSNALAASTGRTNGRGGGPRPLTAWTAPELGASPVDPPKQLDREGAIVMTFGPSFFFERLVRAQLSLGLATRESITNDLVNDGLISRREAASIRRPLQPGLFDQPVPPRETP